MRMVEVTIVHDGGSDIIKDFAFIEESDAFSEAHPDVRVWYGDPEDDDSQFDLYTNASITEVSP